MTLTELSSLIDSGQFHHATDKPFNGCWSGLYIYRINDGLTGFDVAGVFSTYKASPDKLAEYNQAYEMVRRFGVSLGCRGNG